MMCVIFNSVNRYVNSTYKTNGLNRFLIFLTDFSVNVNFVDDMSMNMNTLACGKILLAKVCIMLTPAS